MNSFRHQFKTLAREKRLEGVDMLTLCLYKAVRAETEDRASYYKDLLRETFARAEVEDHRPHPYWAVKLAIKRFQWLSGSGWKFVDGKMINDPVVLHIPAKDVVTEWELKEMVSLSWEVMYDEL